MQEELDPSNLVESAEKKTQTYLVVDVKDTGIGISQENQSKLFKIFGKLKSSSAFNQQGVGLGLTICKRICESMKGWVRVKSELNTGSTFTFCL